MNIIIARLLVLHWIIVVPFLTLYSCMKPSVIVKIRLSVHLSMVNDRMYGFTEILFFHCAMTLKLYGVKSGQKSTTKTEVSKKAIECEIQSIKLNQSKISTNRNLSITKFHRSCAQNAIVDHKIPSIDRPSRAHKTFARHVIPVRPIVHVDIVTVLSRPRSCQSVDLWDRIIFS